VLVDGLMASTGWDELVYVWQHGTDPRAPWQREVFLFFLYFFLFKTFCIFEWKSYV
jgi:hypothetical protein